MASVDLLQGGTSMAKITRFTSPPNWPAPPPGWTPPAVWQPDPAWGPPPTGWVLWVTERANPRGWVHAICSAVALYVVFLVIVLVVSGGRLGAEGAGELFGPFMLGGILVGLIARNGRSRRGRWLYPLAVFGIALAIRVLSFVGQGATGG